ncbi:MAG: hypothetical protein F6K31_38575 [Symploca sp. SIO2G7]|nr:hypothetical protein [Symploca sp. SIO2G7]
MLKKSSTSAIRQEAGGSKAVPMKKFFSPPGNESCLLPVAYFTFLV